MTAHPDDVDFGAAGSVAVWTDAGVEVAYCIVTDGDAGGSDRSMSRADMAAIRREEQREAAKAVGVTDVNFLGFPDGRLTADLELRRAITGVIRRFRPDRVVAQSPERNWTRIYASHPDHLAAGEAAICAVYPDARNPFAFPELLEEGLEPHTVPELWIMATDRADRAVDATDIFDRKLAALRSHRSQVGDGEHLDELLRTWMCGHRPGRRAARRAAGRGLPGGGHRLVGTAAAPTRPPARAVADDRPWVVLQHVGLRGPGAHRRRPRRRRAAASRWSASTAATAARSPATLGRPGGAWAARWASTTSTTTRGWPPSGPCRRRWPPTAARCSGCASAPSSWPLALGAEVTTGAAPEVGLGRVELTADGRRDPVLGPEYGGLAGHAPSPACTGTSDTFSLPAGRSTWPPPALTPHQAFRWGRRAYGLQFHVEVDRALAAAWRPHLPAGVTLDGAGLAEVEAVGRRVLRRFVAWPCVGSSVGRPARWARTGSAGLMRPRRTPGRGAGRCPSADEAGQARSARRLPRGGLLRLAGHRGRRWWRPPRPSPSGLVMAVYAVSISTAVRGERPLPPAHLGPGGPPPHAPCSTTRPSSSPSPAPTRPWPASPSAAGPGPPCSASCGAGAVIGITLRQVWLDAPKWVIALPYVVVGWAALVVLPQLVAVPWAASASPCCWPAGWPTRPAPWSTRVKRPNPVPGVFGYHEVFHACTIVGAVPRTIVGHRLASCSPLAG